MTELYSEHAKKASVTKVGNTGKNLSEIRNESRNRALSAFKIKDLAAKLGILKKGKVLCPSCKEDNLEIDEQENCFKCKNCKKKGNCVHLVRFALDLSFWKAVRYINDLDSGVPQNKPKTQNKSQDKTTKSIAPKDFQWNSPSYKQHQNNRVAEIKSRNSLQQTISSLADVSFKRSGGNLFCRCPFPDHADNKPSFAIHPDKQLFHCFGCGRGGDVLSFVMAYKNYNFKESLDFLDNGSTRTAPVPQTTSASQIPQPDNPGIIVNNATKVELVKKCLNFFEQRLGESTKAQEFLTSRGLCNSELVKYFCLGFDDGRINQALDSQTAQQLQQIGIVNDNSNSRFYQCLTLGLQNLDGHTVSIYGRRIAGDIKHQFPKAQEQAIFNYKGLQHSNEIYLTEGVLDALTLWHWGYHNVSCIFSASNTPQMLLDLIKQKNINKIYLAFDNDSSGNSACHRFCERFAELDTEILRIRLPEGIKDANELQLKNKKAKDLFTELVEQADIISLPKNAKKPSSISDFPLDDKGQLHLTFDDRSYRIRGMHKNLSFDSLRINIRVFLLNRFHIDTLDLYNARQRGSFIKTTSVELGVKQDTIKQDIGKILVKLEQFQELNIRENIKPEKKQVILTEQQKKEALAFLKSPNLISTIQKDFVKCGLVGEEINSLMCYLALTSRKLDDPLAIIIQAFSAAGKTALMNQSLAFIPDEDITKFSAMTGQSLFYLGEKDLVHKILAISEEEGAEKASYALKLLQSEKSLSIASTGKDSKSGRFITYEYKVQGPTQIILTTTAIEIDEELLNRCFLITVSQDRSQTKAIHMKQREKETLTGMLQSQHKEQIIELHQNAQRMLRTIMVVNPYAPSLTFLDTQLRTRRDHMKYLTLIRAIALLHQYQREIKKVEHCGKIIEYIEVELSDIELANKIVNEIMGHSLDELSPQSRRFLSVVTEMVDNNCKQQEIARTDYLFSRKTIRDYSGWSDFQVRTHLAKLVDLEYIVIRSGNSGIRHLYELVYSSEGENGQRFILGLIKPENLDVSHKNQQGEH